MFVPAHFEESRVEVLHDLIVKNPFGVLVTHGSNGLDANHLPFDLEKVEGKLGVLHCHVARANSVWREIANGDEVLVVFQAGDAYVSPNWYPSKHEFHKQVPTWNYIVAHAHGQATIHDDESYVRKVVARLIETHEASQPVPWNMWQSSQQYIDTLLKAIVQDHVEITITRLIGKAKLKPNKDERDIRGVIEALMADGEQTISEAMLAILWR